MQIKISLASGLYRVVAVGICVSAVVLAALVSKWAFGHAVAINATEAEIAAFGVDLAPSDPRTHLDHAFLLEKTFLPADQAKSLSEFEQAAALSPNNYLNWLLLGRAREQAGDPVGAERALSKALELAPNYSRVQWALGNSLLRQGRYDEGFAYIRRAVAADVTFSNPAATAAWQIFGGDVVKIKNALGDSSRINASMAVLLAGNKRYAEALEFWSQVPADEKESGTKEAARSLYAKFIEAALYGSAIEIANSAQLFPDETISSETVSNGDFESALAQKGPSPFSWTIADGSYPAIGLNGSQKHGGNYSLLFNFGQGGKGFRPVSQKIGVRGGSSYEMIFYHRSEVKAQATLVCQIISAADASVLASAVIAASAGWAEIRIPFSVPADTEGIELKINAEGCSADGCSISGNIWFDDFSLVKR